MLDSENVAFDEDIGMLGQADARGEEIGGFDLLACGKAG